MKEILLDYLQGNLWANTRICNFITPEVADKELVSSFPTIRKTLYHIWDAQVIWHKRLINEPLFDWPSKQFTGSLDEARVLFIESSAELLHFLEVADEAELTRSLSYTNMQGKVFTNKVHEILMHVSNHATFHRGQLVTMLRNAGITSLGSTDLIAFYRER